MPWKQLAKGNQVAISIGHLKPVVFKAPNGKIVCGVKLYMNGRVSKQGVVLSPDKIAEVIATVNDLIEGGGGMRKIPLATKFIEVSLIEGTIDILTRWQSGGVIGQSLRVEAAEYKTLLSSLQEAIDLSKVFTDVADSTN